MEQHQEELATIEALDAGAVYTLALKTHVGMSIQTFRYFAGWCDKIQVRLRLLPPSEFIQAGWAQQETQGSISACTLHNKQPQLIGLKQPHLSAHISADGKYRQAGLGSMPEFHKDSVSVWPGWALSGGSGDTLCAGPFRCWQSSVPIDAGLKPRSLLAAGQGCSQLLQALVWPLPQPSIPLLSSGLASLCHELEKTLPLWGFLR